MRKFVISLLIKWDGVIFFFKKGQGFWIGKLSGIITKGSVSISLIAVFFLFSGLFSIGFIGSKYGVVELREVISINNAEEIVDEGLIADQILSSVVPDWERGEFDYERLSTLKPDCFLPQSSSGPFSMASKVSGGKSLDLAIFGISSSEKEKIVEDLNWCFVEQDWVFRGKGVFARVFVDEGLLLLAAGTGNGSERQGARYRIFFVSCAPVALWMLGARVRSTKRWQVTEFIVNQRKRLMIFYLLRRFLW